MWSEESTDPVERAALSAASLINAVGALMEDLVEASTATQQEVAARMGVTPGRVSQLLAGDGNVRIATLARLAHACGSDISFTAVDRRTGERTAVPRGPRAGRNGHAPAAGEPGVVADPVEASTMAAAALINAVGALMDDLIEAGPVKKQDIAARMGVTPARVSQLLAGDGNVRIATLARLAEAVGSDLTLTATGRATGAQLVAPRPRVRGVRERGGACAPEATPAQVRDRMKALAPVVELRCR